MKKPALKTKRTARTSKTKATAPPANPTRDAWQGETMQPFAPEQQRQADAIGRSMSEWKTKDNRRRLRVDPTARHDDFLASLLGWTLSGKLKPIDRAAYGEHLLTMLEELEPDELETAFAAFVRMKRAAEKDKAGTLGRYSKWARLRCIFKKEKRRDVESKQEFEQYAARQNQPMPASASGKTRIYKLLGMKDFPQKRGGGK